MLIARTAVFSPDAPATPSGSTSNQVGRESGSFWTRIRKVQELGLVAVIVVMMTFITFAAGNVSRADSFSVPRGVTVTETPTEFVYTPPGTGSEQATSLTPVQQHARSFAKADGWTLTTRGNSQRLERKEVRPLPPGQSADAPLPQELVDAKWSIGSDPVSGSAALVRDPMVNKFLNQQNLINAATSAAFYAIMAVGLTAIIVLGGIDLSVGAIYALAAVCGAYVLNSMQSSAGAGGGAAISMPVAIITGLLVCCIVGTVCGLINGAASVGLGVHPFIITLGGMGVYRGTAFVTTKGQSIGDLPPAFGDAIRTRIGDIFIVPAAVMVVVGIAGAWVFSRTVFGRRVFAVGGNEVAAKYAGVPVALTKIKVFTIAGLLAGLSAFLALGYYGAASSADGTGYELEVIAAAVVGGASLSGGRGTALGAVLGAIIIQLINNGFDVLGFDANYRQIVIGLAIVLAVVIDQVQHRLSKR
jgi:ribose/xylose/arabinose/galactoside ABC-type transport system permease subunit